MKSKLVHYIRPSFLENVSSSVRNVAYLECVTFIMGSIAVVSHHEQGLVEQNNGLCLENSTVVGLLTLKDPDVDLVAICVRHG